MIDEKYFNERNLFILATIISVLYFIFLIPISHLEFQQYDAYYYQSLSHALVHDGRLQDYTTIPAREVLTPQNGIVFLYSLLEQMGVDEKVTQLRIVALINGFLIIISTIYLFRIFRLFGLSKMIAFLLALTFPLSFFYQFILLLQKNDCIFITLSLITIYKLLHTDKPTDSLASLIVLAATMALFRISGVLIFASALITFILKKQYKDALVSLGLILVSISTLYLTLLLFDINTSRMGSHSREIMSLYSWDFVFQHIEKTLTLSIPESIFRFTYYTTNIPLSSKLVGLIISILFIILLFINIRNTISGKVDNKYGMIFLIIYVLTTLVFFQLHKAQPTRYLLTISPLIPLFLFTLPGLKKSHVKAVFVAIVTASISVIGIVKSDKFSMAHEKNTYWQSYSKEKQLEHMPLIAYFPRVSYFLLNKRSLRDVPENINVPEEGLIIVGPDIYIRFIAGRIEGINSGKYNIRILPIAYHDYNRIETGPFYFPYQKMSIKTIVIKHNVSGEK